MDKLTENTKKQGIRLYGLNNPYQGIVHVIGPELGFTQPGMTIVCGDSHTSTHGAFGCVAFGIGTSEVEMVLATQCILQPKPKKMRITVNGNLGKGSYCKGYYPVYYFTRYQPAAEPVILSNMPDQPFAA